MSNGAIFNPRPVTQIGTRLSVSMAQGRVRLELAPRGKEPYVAMLEPAVAVDIVLQMGRILEALLPGHPGLIKHDR